MAESFGWFLIFVAGAVGFLSWRFKKFDSDNQIRGAAKGVAVRFLEGLLKK